MKVINNIMMFSFICLIGVFCFVNGSTEASQDQSLLISLEVDQQELKDVLGIISKQTGFTIKVDNNLVSHRVTGKYFDVSVEQFFYRILREYNVSILVNKSDKSIVVRSFGEKETSMYSVLYPAEGGVEPLTGISMSEIKSTQAHEDEISRKYYENPESIEPLTGMTLRQIEVVRVREEEEVHKQNEIVEPLTGVSLSEIKSIRARENESSRKYYENPESIEPLTGLTLRQIEIVRINEERAVRGD